MAKLTVKLTDIHVGSNAAFLHESDMCSLGVKPGKYIRLATDHAEGIALAVRSDSIAQTGVVALSSEASSSFSMAEGTDITLLPRRAPPSYQHVRKKYRREQWSQTEISEIVEDIRKGLFTDLELGAFTLSQMFQDLSIDETEYLSRAMAAHGDTIDFEETAYDKHSIGGIPGNKVTLIIVPIVAAAGLLIPKTSSRAITSPSGTGDTMEVLANVSFTASELQEIAPKVRGMIVWGGNLNLAPVDDIIIKRTEHPLNIDPRSQMIASIMSKKISTGVDNMVLDIPVGIGAKIEDRETAAVFARDFVEIGRRVGMTVEAALTYGGQPLGHAVGPALEAKEALETLLGPGPTSVREKATELAGILFEHAGLVRSGKGQSYAEDILKSGKALTKFREIIAAQGGNPNIMPEEVPLGDHIHDVLAPSDGYLVNLSNTAVKRIARAAGAPSNHGAGIYIHRKTGEFVKKDEPVFTVYAEQESKLTDALLVASSANAFSLEGMVLQRIGGI